jgi:CubicO group peptidase (beta-lactamase class C family)
VRRLAAAFHQRYEHPHQFISPHNSPMNRGSKWSLTRKILVSLSILTFLLISAFAILVASEWAYIQRIRHFKQQLPTPPEWYEPKQPVPGGATIRTLPRITSEAAGIPTNLISQALQTATNAKASAFLILKNGAIAHEYYAPNHGPDRWTDSASMMKTVTALLVGIAISEGQIKSVDEPAATYFPAWAKDNRKQITIKNLLQMHSGLRPQGAYDDPFSDACYLALGTDTKYIIENSPLIETPGAHYDYNNINFQALGFILENATRKIFADYLSEKLWLPLGNREAALWLDKPNGEPRTFGYLFATAEDWARVGQLILDCGKLEDKTIVPSSWIDFMSTPTPTEPTYGAGLYTGVDDSEDPPFAYKGIVALNGKDKQRVYILPREKILIIRVGPQVRGWNDSYFPNLFAN